MESVVINDVADFVKIISDINEKLISEYGRKEILLFRGQSDEKNILLPSIGRTSEEFIGSTFIKEEMNMIEMAKYKLPELFGSSMQPIDLLALLQHHGIPTRLLDISENALVSLYFACNNDIYNDTDGEVLVFQYKKHEVVNFPMVNAIAESYRFVRKDYTSLQYFYNQVKNQPYFANKSYLYDNETGIEIDGSEWVKKTCEDIMIIYARSYGLRQRIQRGRYILFPNSIEKNEAGQDCFIQNITPIPKDHPAIIGRVIIPKENKAKINEQLRLLGVSKDMLFLDNEDIICKEIADRVKQDIAW